MEMSEEEVDRFFDHINFKTKKVSVSVIYEVVYVKQFDNIFKLTIESIDHIPENEDFNNSQIYLNLEEALLDAHSNNMLVKLL